MHAGKSYKLSEFLFWTRRKVYVLVPLGVIPVVLYQLAGIKWFNIPWPVVALLGTATAFTVGFKNTQTYNRTAEAQHIWTNIASLSWIWGTICRDYVNDAGKTKELIYRHLAWLTALRYQMREERIWETANKKHNAEYRRYYTVPERDTMLETALARYTMDDEVLLNSRRNNNATNIIGLQGKTIKKLFDDQQIAIAQFLEMQKSIKEFYLLQGRSEEIKNAPYPRQYAIINTFFVRLFCLLLPFGMLKEFDKLNDITDGIMKGYMVWLVVPFSIIISWMYTSLEQVGESTENPFEGGANDVPITRICRKIEIELCEILGETNLPSLPPPQNNIIL